MNMYAVPPADACIPALHYFKHLLITPATFGITKDTTWEHILRPETMRHVYAFGTNRHTIGYDTQIILDNGVWELGKSLPSSILIKIADSIQANIVVAPDAFKDANTTYFMIKEALEDSMFFHWLRAKPNRRMMIVPQGANRVEWTQAYAYWSEHLVEQSMELGGDLLDRTIIGIPKWLAMTDDMAYYLEDGRIPLFGHLSQLVHHHLLGFGGFKEMLVALEYPQIKSIDSCLPFVASQNNVPMIVDYTTQVSTKRWPAYNERSDTPVIEFNDMCLQAKNWMNGAIDRVMISRRSPERIWL